MIVSKTDSYILNSILILTFLLSLLEGSAQNPLDYGQSDSVYFISQNQIDALEIQSIYIVEVLNDTGGMNENIDLTEIDFTSHYTDLSDEWYACYDSIYQYPVLDSVIANAMFINGYYWNYNGDTLSAAGMEGYGTLCMSFYENVDDYVQVETMCKRESTVEFRKIYYHENGLPKYSVCCEWWDDDEYLEEDYIPNPVSDYVLFGDTIHYIYDGNWKYMGTKAGANSELLPVFGEDLPKYYGPFYQIYVAKAPMENYIQSRLGFKPKRILIEIYRKAALMFLYDSKIEKYVQVETIVLE